MTVYYYYVQLYVVSYKSGKFIRVLGASTRAAKETHPLLLETMILIQTHYRVASHVAFGRDDKIRRQIRVVSLL